MSPFDLSTTLYLCPIKKHIKLLIVLNTILFFKFLKLVVRTGFEPAIVLMISRVSNTPPDCIAP